MSFERRYELADEVATVTSFKVFNLKSSNDLKLGISMPENLTNSINDSLQLSRATSMLENPLDTVNDSSKLPHAEYKESSAPTFIQFSQLSSSWPEHLEVDTITTARQEKLSDEKSSDFDPSSVLDLLQCGIEICLQNLLDDHERDVLMTDFSTIEVIHFRRRGPNVAKHDFDFHVYAPIAFRFFRELFGITTEEFLTSLCKAPLCLSSVSGSSGSKFYTTNDDRFIIKTVKRKETDFLINLFPGYYLNLTQHKKTLLPKFFGLYSYVRGHRRVRYLVMNNLLPTDIKFHEKYDLKGATYYRRKSVCSVNDCTERYVSVTHCKLHGVSITFKDLDFIEKWPHGLYFRQNVYKMLMRSIERDCKVLESYGIMDYSLLLGIHIPDQNSPTFRKESKKSPSVQNVATAGHSVSSKPPEKLIQNVIGPFEARTMRGEIVYLYMGIIDILQSYEWKKKLEYCCKSIIFSSSTISVNRPDFYSERFQSFLKKYVFKCIPELISIQDKKICQPEDSGKKQLNN